MTSTLILEIEHHSKKREEFFVLFILVLFALVLRNQGDVAGSFLYIRFEVSVSNSGR